MDLLALQERSPTSLFTAIQIGDAPQTILMYRMDRAADGRHALPPPVRPRVRDTANENTRVARRDAPAMRHNARHRRAQEFRTVFASVPKLFQLHVRNRQCLPVILKHATVRKTVASANVKSRSAKC